MFLWSSKTLSNLPAWAWDLTINPLLITIRLTAVSMYGPAGYHFEYYLVDGLALTCFVLSFLGLRHYFGTRKATLFLSIDIVVWESLLGIFDTVEFNIHVVSMQEFYHVGLGFTNADLWGLAVAASVFLWTWIYRPAWLLRLKSVVR